MRIRAFQVCVFVISFVTAMAVPVTQAGAASSVAHAVVAVPGSQQWTDTGLTIEAGTELSVAATGTIYVGGFNSAYWYESPHGRGTVSHDGSSCSLTGSVGGQFPLGDVPCWSLIAKVGSAGSVFYLGSNGSHTVAQSGEVFLGPNDNELGNNSGEWSADVSVASLRYDEVQQKATHNSFGDANHLGLPDKPSLAQQLKDGVRSLEFDIHKSDPFGDATRAEWAVYHKNAVDEAATRCNPLSVCLTQVEAYRSTHASGAVLTIKIDLSHLAGKGEARWPSGHTRGELDQELEKYIPRSAIETPGDLKSSCPDGGDALANIIKTCGWPYLSDLRGKVIFVIASDTCMTQQNCDISNSYDGSGAQTFDRDCFVLGDGAAVSSDPTSERIFYGVGGEGTQDDSFWQRTFADVRAVRNAGFVAFGLLFNSAASWNKVLDHRPQMQIVATDHEKMPIAWN